MMGTSLPALMVLFIWFDRISEGAGLGCPSSPLCYRNRTGASHYICEWNMNTADKVKFMLYVDNEPHGPYDRSPVEIVDEALICRRPVNISVKVFDGNSSCTSPTTTVVLEKIVKFAAPRNVSLSWSEENLKMVWMQPKDEPAEAEVLYRQHQNPAAEWKKVKHNSQCQLNAEADFVHHVADEPHWCQASFENFAKNLSYQVRLRHKSKQATQPLWSDWSPVMIVPAALTHEPEIDISREVEDDSRKVTIKWNPKQPVAAGVGGITYIVRETHGCPCEKEEVRNGTENYVTYVSKSSVYISVVTKNKAGYSPRAAKQIPLESTEHLKTCSGTLLQEKLRRKKCFELYQTQDGGLKQDNVITFTAKSKPMDKMMDYVRYLYFGYECVDDRPAIKTCLIYKEQGVPRKEPPDFIGFSNSQTTANLSWREIPTVYQQGFVTHYHLCSVRIGFQDERRECHNVSAPQANISHQTILKYQMRNMTAGAKYNISVAGVTREGEGPPAGLVLQSQPEDKSVDVLLGIGLVLAFLFIVGVLVLFKRFRGRILPPVPKPVIFHFNPNQAGHQGLLVKKDEQQQQEEQVHEFTLHQNPPDETEMCFHATTETWGHTGSDMSDETSSNPEFTELNDPEEFGGDLVQFTSLLYKRGLVFDMKTDSDLYQSN